ncbi:MAG: hypothetical protein Q7U47_04805 [Paludibacter sp.]|nr:hypothetical protein [Paludibacter sp.]
MITLNSHTIKPALRFRRWSRTNYAVFISLGVSVTIGVLSDSVAEKSLQKIKNSNTEISISTQILTSDEKDFSLEYELISEHTAELLITENSSDNAAAGSLLFFFILTTNG